MPRIASDLYGRKNAHIAHPETRDLASNPTSHSLPYPDNTRIMERVDAEGSHRDQFAELANSNFLWAQACMTSRRVEDREDRFPNRDRLLERLFHIGYNDTCPFGSTQ